MADLKPSPWPPGGDPESRHTRFHNLSEVIAAEDVEKLREAIKCGIDVNEHHNSHMGALNGYSFMAKVRPDDYIQALHIAAYYGWTKGVELLLDAGANINALDRKTGPKQEDQRFTPLMYACYRRNVSMAELLVSRGADVSLSSRGETALSLAVVHFNLPILQMLQRHIKESPVVPVTEDLFMCSVAMYLDPVLKIPRPRHLPARELQLRVTEIKDTALQLMELCLKDGVDPNTEHADTAHLPLHLCAKSSNDDMRGLDLLLSYGADINRRTNTGEERHLNITPLCYACLSYNNLPVIKWFIQHGAKVNTTFKRAPRGCTTGRPVCLMSTLFDMGLYENAWILFCAGHKLTSQSYNAIKEFTLATQAANRLPPVQNQEQALHEKLAAQEELASNMFNFMSEPRSLKWLCRSVLREDAGLTLPQDIETLPLPQPLKDCLLCLDI